MKDEELKIEAMRCALAVLCQGETATMGGTAPKPADVLDAAKTFYEWFKG